MTDKRKYPSLHPIAKGALMGRIALTALLCSSVLAQVAHAATQQWWFDVEVILFERNLDTAAISETFQQSRLLPPASDHLDLLTSYLNPDLSYLRAGLPYCRESKRLAVKAQYEQDFAFPLPLETNQPTSLVEDTPLQQAQQSNQSEAVDSTEILEKTFQYEVATTDVFLEADESLSASQTTETKNINRSASEPNNNDNADQQFDAQPRTEFSLARPPIEVEFIEWQIPSEFLCAYAEQIDPSFAAITALKNTQFATQLTKQTKPVPEIINGIEWQQKRAPFLLPSANMRMGDLYDKINRQRDITPILHLNWRQEVTFGRENAQTFRLFAGKNFAAQFDADGLPLIDDTDSLFDSLNQPTEAFYIPEQELLGLTSEQQQILLADHNGTGSEFVTEDLFAKIDSALADGSPISLKQLYTDPQQQPAKSGLTSLKEIWQLDGGITVYLRNVGRVPYLHIDSNLDFRQPIFDANTTQNKVLLAQLAEAGAITVNQLQQPNYLQSVNFNQLRRVISRQVHYFDHPLFGMVVLIHRYRWPEAEQETEQETDANDNDL